MHSRIFEISAAPFVSSNDWMPDVDSDDFNMLPSGIDYVNEIDDDEREGDLKGLEQIFPERLNDGGFLVPDDFISKTLDSKFDNLKKKVHDMTRKEFYGHFVPYQLERLINDKYGFLFYYEQEVFSESELARLFHQTGKPEILYVEKIWDYHF